jgi:hypothetical protein
MLEKKNTQSFSRASYFADSRLSSFLFAHFYFCSPASCWADVLLASATEHCII